MIFDSIGATVCIYTVIFLGFCLFVFEFYCDIWPWIKEKFLIGKFKNKFERKINFKYKKIDKFRSKLINKVAKCENKIKKYRAKSRYVENVKLLHDKTLDDVVFVNEDYFNYLQKCEKERKRKVK